MRNLEALCLVLAVGVPVFAQSRDLTVVTNTSTVTVSNPKLLVNSSKGYMMGSGNQDFGGVYVTDAVVPPVGVELQKSLVNWKDISKLEVVDPNLRDGNRSFFKAKLTLTSGKFRDVFLWTPSSSGFYPQSTFTVSGKMTIQGSVQDVEVNASGLKSLEFSAAK